MENELRIYFSFGTHGDEAAQFYIPAIEQQIRNFFDSNSHNIYIKEAAGVHPDKIKLLKKRHQQLGTLEKAFEIITPDLFHNSENQLLDKIASNLNFDVEYETSSPKHAAQLQKMFERYQRDNVFGVKAIQEGNLQQAVRSANDCVITMASMHRIRHQGYIIILSKFAEQAYKRNEPIKIFIRIGDSHDTILEDLKKSRIRFLREASINYDYDLGQELLLPLEVLTKKAILEPGFRPSYSELASSVLAGLVDSQLKITNQPLEQRYKKAISITQNTSLEEIETFVQLCPTLSLPRALGQLIASKLW